MQMQIFEVSECSECKIRQNPHVNFELTKKIEAKDCSKLVKTKKWFLCENS